MAKTKSVLEDKYAPWQLAALAPDMARAGQALVEALRKEVHDPERGYLQPCACAPCQAIDAWRVLGEAKEGRE